MSGVLHCYCCSNWLVRLLLCRDGDINQLRAEIHEVLGNRNVSDEKFQAVVLDEIAALKVGTNNRHQLSF